MWKRRQREIGPNRRQRRAVFTTWIALFIALAVVAPFGIQFSRSVPPALSAVDQALGQRFPAFAAVQALLQAR